MVNGIVGLWMPQILWRRALKPVRLIMAAHSQLKYGARLINSYLCDNSTISCFRCEVSSLIFPLARTAS